MTTPLLAPRDDLIRGVSELRADGDGNTMVGYPIVFDTWTEIDSWEGRFLERISPGATTKTIKENGSRIKVQFDHGMHPVIGSLPIGKPDVMRADDLGLWTETPLSLADDVQSLIKPRLQEGSLDGMSFRFSVIDENWDERPKTSKHNPDGLPERTVRAMRIYEYGPVTWPAYEATQVGIRSQAGFAAWMQQDPSERQMLMDRFSVHPPRELIRVRGGQVIIDRQDNTTSDPSGAGNDDRAAAPDEGHEERSTDTAASSHESFSEPDADERPIRSATRPPTTREQRKKIAAAARRKVDAITQKEQADA